MARQAGNRVRVRRGRLTIPATVWRAAKLPGEGTFVVQPMGKGLFLIPEEKMTPFLEAAFEFRRQADAAGVTLQDLLDSLEEERTAYYRGVYGTK